MYARLQNREVIINTLVQPPKPEQQDGGLGSPTARGHRPGLASENGRELSRRRIFEFRIRSALFFPFLSLFLSCLHCFCTLTNEIHAWSLRLPKSVRKHLQSKNYEPFHNLTPLSPKWQLAWNISLYQQ